MATIDIYNTPRRYSVLYADPPWRYKGREGLAGKNSYLDGKGEIVYQSMSLKDIKKLPVPEICEKDAILFMWVVSPMMPDCLSVLDAWGFSYSTVGFVWEKERINPGHYTLSSCEICVIGRKGKIPTPRGGRNIRQFLSEKKTEHSKKPLEIRERIMAMFPQQKKIELFARTTAVGWDCWGDEV